MTEQLNNHRLATGTGYVSAEELLVELFPNEASRPTVRWVRKMAAMRILPYRKINRRVWFSVEECRRAIDRNFHVAANGNK